MPRSALTLLELVLVLGLMLAGTTVTVGGVFASLRTGTVDDAVRIVEQTCRTAQEYAVNAGVRANASGTITNAAWRYGVVLVDVRNPAGRSWVALTYGPEATAAYILKDPSGAPVLRAELPRGCCVFSGPSSTSLERLSPDATSDQSLGWMFQYDSAWLTLTPTVHLKPTFVGVDDSRIMQAGLDPAACVRGSAMLAIGTPDRGVMRSVELFPAGSLASRPVR